MHKPTILFLSIVVCLAAGSCKADRAGGPLAPAMASVQSSLSAPDGSIDDELDDEADDGGAYSLAVIGDIPYGPAKLAEFPSFIAKINSDPAVRLVAHVGDVKAGSNSPCTDEYLTNIRSLFDTFVDPVVYTPGDNEWTDCHQDIKNNGLYTPTERLVKVRQLFFPAAGRTLGVNSTRVATQARDPRNAAYVENTMFRRAGVVFAAINITGSNNDLASWGTHLPADAASYPSQAAEYASRAAANSAWIDKAFALAKKTQARGVVLLFQADMWDPAEPTLTGFDAIVPQIGNWAVSFGKPVLLIDGDSHKYKVDNPYSASSPFHGMHPSTPIADNVTRIVVEGSGGRTEYVRLKIDPSRQASALFSWERVPNVVPVP